MPDAGLTDPSLPLPSLLSQLLVAFTIEFDNEFEHQMPHRTTRHGSAPGRGVPWLVSMAMWVHCMRFVPSDGIPAGELARRSGLSAKAARMLVQRMGKWWGYLAVEPCGSGASAPASAWLVRPTPAGRQAQQVWQPLTEMVESRWQARFGAAAIDRLRASMQGIVSQFGLRMPDYLPIGAARLQPRPAGQHEPDDAFATSLPALMSKILLALALDFEDTSDLALGIYTEGGPHRLAISANVLRIMDGQPVRVTDIPALTGVAKMATDNWLGALHKHRYLLAGPDPAGSRHKVAELTAKGNSASQAYRRWADGIEQAWQHRFGAAKIKAVRDSAEPIAADPALAHGLKPYPDGWRAQVRPPATLPHYPLVSARGGFPDGS